MYAINMQKNLKGVFIWPNNNQILSLFNRAISEKKRDQVSTIKKIEKIRSRTVSVIFGSHHMTRTAACFTLMSRTESLPHPRI